MILMPSSPTWALYKKMRASDKKHGVTHSRGAIGPVGGSGGTRRGWRFRGVGDGDAMEIDHLPPFPAGEQHQAHGDEGKNDATGQHRGVAPLKADDPVDRLDDD